MKKGKLSKIIQTIGMVLVAGVVIGVNVAVNHFSEIISIYLGGFGADFSEFDSSAGNNMCQEIESEGVVLLKNDGVALPLTNKNEKGKIPIALFGWGATDGGFITSGSGSGGSAERGSGKLVTLLGALEGQPAMTRDGKETLPEVKGQFEYYHPLMDMYSSYKAGRDRGDYWNAAYPFFNLIEPTVDKVQPHIAGAKEFSNTAVVVIARAGGEGQDIPRIQKKFESNLNDYSRTYLDISKEEEDMLNLVKENFEKVVVIIDACNAMNLSFLDDPKIDAAISISGAGQSGAVAIADILSGKINPSGKTVDTYAYDFSTAATFANAPDCREINGEKGGIRKYTNSDQVYVDYAEGIYNGYRWYETADEEGFWNSEYAKTRWGVEGYDQVVQYPFGYGLSYTSFTQEILSISPADNSYITPESDIVVKVKVTNTGTVAGKEVVELYYNPPYTPGGVEKSAVNLVSFAKTGLIKPGEAEELTLTFKASDMKSYDTENKSGVVGEDGGYVLEAGEYEISLRSDAHNVIDSVNYFVDASTAIDEETVHNRFTGTNVTKGDVSIDGRDTNEGITYLTRNNFKETFPAPRAARARSEKMPADGWLPTDVDTDVMPTQGKAGEYRLYKDGNKLNEELVLRLGKDYNDPLWDEVLNQVTVDELYGVIQGGGFRTKAVNSVGKPEHLDLDGPSGLNQEINAGGSSTPVFWTSFPIETAIAQTWNENISLRFGLTMGYEAYVTGVAGWYAPAANIHRSPFDGRNFEYYSEDPLLSGKMCAKTIEGATDNGLYCYLKHFVVNETENKREGLLTWLNEQSLREIYARSFEITVKEGGANAIMSAFNRLGATWCGGNYGLLTGVLRDEWGFRGSVLTDYALDWEMGFMDIDQGIRAGNDMWLNGLRSDSIGTIRDRGSATSVTAARKATKNMLYTFCNTMYRQSEYLKNPVKDAPASTLVGKTSPSAAKTWIWIIVGVDAVAVIGLGIWVYFCYFHKKKEKKAKAGQPVEEVTPDNNEKQSE